MRLFLPPSSLKSLSYFHPSIPFPAFPLFPTLSHHQFQSSHRRLNSTTSSLSNRYNRSSPSPILSLKQFLLRQRVLALYRSILRATSSLPGTSTTRAELRKYARDEFERNKGVEDESKIGFLVRLGKEDLGRLGLKG